jgi:uncharacterized protein YheU (UPF0270 family)
MDENEESSAAIDTAEGQLEVPYEQLAPDTLRRVIQDLVTRDGTDYGLVEKSVEQKAAALMRLLERGEAKLVVDLATESIGLLTADELARSRR